MAMRVQGNGPVIQNPQVLPTMRQVNLGNSEALMTAQAKLVRRIEESVTRMKAERERFFRNGKNSPD